MLACENAWRRTEIGEMKIENNNLTLTVGSGSNASIRINRRHDSAIANGLSLSYKTHTAPVGAPGSRKPELKSVPDRALAGGIGSATYTARSHPKRPASAQMQTLSEGGTAITPRPLSRQSCCAASRSNTTRGGLRHPRERSKGHESIAVGCVSSKHRLHNGSALAFQAGRAGSTPALCSILSTPAEAVRELRAGKSRCVEHLEFLFGVILHAVLTRAAGFHAGDGHVAASPVTALMPESIRTGAATRQIAHIGGAL